MRIDLRVKHDVETRRHAAELFDSGAGCLGRLTRLSDSFQIEPHPFQAPKLQQ